MKRRKLAARVTSACTDAEEAAWQRLAKAYRLSLSELIRKQMNSLATQVNHLDNPKSNP